jgi:anthranilate synthase/aminodeoxychorismate synthase-like glutamine amidotransferase
MLFIIDNYDSFTYNLVQYFGELGEEMVVYRNDAITVNEIENLCPRAIVVSPGPCTPREAGISIDAIRYFSGKVPILGVCLGHQAIGYSLGADVVRAKTLIHGKTSPIFHDGKSLFKDLQNPFMATRYHSLAVSRESLKGEIEVSAWTEDGEIMGIRHARHILEGVQFHPESILTRVGKDILRNFLDKIDT